MSSDSQLQQAVGAALFSIGIPHEGVVRYERALKADQFLVVAHGPQAGVERARTLLQDSGALLQDSGALLQDSGALQLDMHTNAPAIASLAA